MILFELKSGKSHVFDLAELYLIPSCVSEPNLDTKIYIFIYV